MSPCGGGPRRVTVSGLRVLPADISCSNAWGFTSPGLIASAVAYRTLSLGLGQVIRDRYRLIKFDGYRDPHNEAVRTRIVGSPFSLEPLATTTCRACIQKQSCAFFPPHKTTSGTSRFMGLHIFNTKYVLEVRSRFKIADHKPSIPEKHNSYRQVSSLAHPLHDRKLQSTTSAT